MMDMIGRPTNGKPINLAQLESELEQGGLSIDAGMGYCELCVYTYDAGGTPCDFDMADHAAVEAGIAAHVAMRDKTDSEYAAEFQNPATTPERRQEIRDQQSGLLPREQVAVTQEEWDKQTTSTLAA